VNVQVNDDIQPVTQIRNLLRRVRSGFLPPPELRVSEFSDAHIIVTSGPLTGTRWKTDFAPYQRGILDAFHEQGVEIVVVMGSSQWGKTACAVNIVAYHIAHDPCSILVVEPTVDPMAKDFAKNRIEPVIAATEVLSEKVSKRRAKDASNTTLQKTFRGGSLAIGGANSAASLAARATRLLILDEIDRYPAELPGEGNTLAIAMKRTTAYGSRRRIGMFSSPTLVDGPIHFHFKKGDQRRYHVPCPSCDTMHPFEWANVRWENDDPKTARMHCPACDHPINDAERVAILARGEWIAERQDRPEKHIVSFHLWEAYSPMSSLHGIVSNFLSAREKQKAGDNSEMHTWQNTTLGEPIEPDKGEGVEPHVLLLRRESFGSDDVDLPMGVCCLTMGVDVQDERLELVVVGWGVKEESWVIDRQMFPGDTRRPEPWDSLTEVLEHQYRHENGLQYPILAACIDSAGHRTDMVYHYAATYAARRVYAVIGRGGQQPIVSSPSPRRYGQGERTVPLYTIGVDGAKAIVVSRLALTERGPGYVHLPHSEWCDEEFAAQLTSERLVTKLKKGIRVQEWKKIRPRNEALDCYVYALGAFYQQQPDSKRRADWLAEQATKLANQNNPSRPPPAPPVTTPPKKTGWVPARKSWLRG
jgi:phage terminase large subunit GpA-like protein